MASRSTTERKRNAYNIESSEIPYDEYRFICHSNKEFYVDFEGCNMVLECTVELEYPGDYLYIFQENNAKVRVL